MYASGSSARQTTLTKDKPCDAVIMAIVDTWDVDGETLYTK
jgi:ethanolamine utilization protein EutN/carbon dioxide concentrating mechanism protein CcmL